MVIFAYKKTIAMLVAILFVASALYLTRENPVPIVVENSINTDQVASVQTSIARQDGDQDGLEEWEETLWGSDPNSADTDGDGTNDGDEVAQGRNPTIAGPDDLVVGSVTPDGQKIGISGTDVIAEKFITEYFLLREKRGGFLSENDEIRLIEELVKEVTLPVTTVAFKETDFTRIVENTAQNMKKYGNMVGGSIVENSPSSLENEFVIFARAFQDENEAELDKLDPIIEGYAGVQRVLTDMDVPENARAMHTDLVNTIASLRGSIRAMRNAFTDPVGGIAGVEQYQIDVENFRQVLVDIDEYFYENNVTFGENEHGSILVQTI